MSRLAVSGLMLLALFEASDAGAVKFGFYEIALVDAKVSSGDLDSVLAIRADTTQKGVVSYWVEFDSTRITWTRTKGWIEYECRNESAEPVFLIWDSATAVDLRGYLMLPLPTGLDLYHNLSTDPKKIKKGKPFSGSFMTGSKTSDGVFWNFILPTNSDDYRQDFPGLVSATVGKNFKLVLPTRRKDLMSKYRFTFTVLKAEVR